MNDILIAIILGIVEGFSEFLPISSTGHLIIVRDLLNFKGEFSDMFIIVIQLGAILGVVVHFWHKLNPLSSLKSAQEKTDTWDIWKKTIVGVIPAIIIGSIVGKHLHKIENSYVVSTTLIIGGILILWVESRLRNSKYNHISELSYKTVFLIGLFQCLSMIPGTSRSAATIITAILLGSSRMVAAEFSFFLAIPTMVAATGYSLMKSGLHLTSRELLVTGVGFVVSFLVAWAVIAAFMKFISRNNFKPFGYYRIVLGVIVLGYFYFMR